MTRHCDMVQDSQACHHCGADFTLGGECGRSRREEETTPLQEFTHEMWRQRMGMSSYAHGGWSAWLHRSNNNLILDQAWTNEQVQMEGHTAAWNSSRKGHPAGSGPKSESKEHHSMTKSPSSLSPSLPTPHTPNPTPNPPPLPPSPTTSIPNPWSAYKASHNTSSPHDITRWLKLLAAPECGMPPVATETT